MERCHRSTWVHMNTLTDRQKQRQRAPYQRIVAAALRGLPGGSSTLTLFAMWSSAQPSAAPTQNHCEAARACSRWVSRRPNMRQGCGTLGTMNRAGSKATAMAQRTSSSSSSFCAVEAAEPVNLRCTGLVDGIATAGAGAAPPKHPCRCCCRRLAWQPRALLRLALQGALRKHAMTVKDASAAA